MKFKDFSTNFFSDYIKLLEKVDFNSIEKFINILLDARRRNAHVFLIGNGGSAATASHFAQDLSFFNKQNGFKPIKAISLTDNVPAISALGNDYGYENIFVDQLRVLLKKGDVLVAISGSGNSLNLVKAVNYANKNGAITVGLLGFDGGKMKKMCKHHILISTEKGEYEIVESIHLSLTQLIRRYLKFKFSG